MAKEMMKSVVTGAALTLVATMASATDAAAQATNSASNVAPGPEAEGTASSDIIVTANKRAQSLQDVAGSVSALSADDLATRAVTSITDLARQTPGVNIASNSGTTRITIRGVGLQVATGVAEANVAQHIDGIFQSQATMPQLAPVDLERIEVLRGPQGTLYGRNATGGTINFIAKKPTDRTEFGLSAGIGSFDARRLDGYVAGPLVGDALMGRASAYFNRDAGYYRNTFLNTRFNAQRNYGFRGALRSKPTPDITIDLSAYYQREEGSYPPQTLLRGDNQFLEILRAFNLLAPGEGVVDRRPYHTTADFDPVLRKWTWGGTLEVQADATRWLQIRSLTGLTRHRYGPSYFDGDGVDVRLVQIGSPSHPREQRAQAFSQEFNFSGETADDRLRYLVGLYYFDGTLDALIPAIFPDVRVQTLLGAGVAPGARFLQQDQRLNEKTTSRAVFADVTYSVTPELRLNLGSRYSTDRKKSLQNIALSLDFGGGATTVPLCSNLLTQQSFNQFNAKARVEWDVAPHALAYVQYQNGFKDGGVNLSGCGDAFDPEKLASIEAGIKSSWLDNAITFNASVFRYRYKNLQITAFRNNTDAFVDNVPQSTTHGGEFDMVVRPARGFDVNATVAVLKTRIDELVSFDQEQPARGLQDLRGRPLPNSPRFTLTAGAQYEVQTAFGAITPRIEVYHSSSYNFRLFNNPIDRQDAYTIANALVTIAVGDKYRVRGFVKNFTDRAVLNQLLYSPLSGVAGEYGRPREWGVDVGLAF